MKQTEIELFCHYVDEFSIEMCNLDEVEHSFIGEEVERLKLGSLLKKFTEVLLEKRDAKPNFKSGDLLLINDGYVEVFNEDTWTIVRENDQWWINEDAFVGHPKEDVQLLTNDLAKSYIERLAKYEVWCPKTDDDGIEDAELSIKYYREFFKKHGLDTDYIFANTTSSEVEHAD